MQGQVHLGQWQYTRSTLSRCPTHLYISTAFPGTTPTTPTTSITRHPTPEGHPTPKLKLWNVLLSSSHLLIFSSFPLASHSLAYSHRDSAYLHLGLAPISPLSAVRPLPLPFHCTTLETFHILDTFPTNPIYTLFVSHQGR